MQQQQQQQLPPPPQHPPPQGGGGGEFYRGPPMRQLSAASSTNLTPEYVGHPGPPPQQQHQPPYDAYGDSFGAKRMRKPVQRRTVDYTSSVVRYVQVIWTFLWRFTMIQNLFSFSFRIFILYAFFFFVYIFARNLQCLSFGTYIFLPSSSADFHNVHERRLACGNRMQGTDSHCSQLQLLS